MPTILIADDNRLSRELVRDILETADCRIIEARDGAEALALLDETPPDLLLLDLEMPAQDGFAVLREVRRNPRFAALPVAAFTARAMQQEREKIQAAGFDACITKPVMSAALRKRVQELLSLRRGRV
ncbi:MAG: response regulator [Acidobacteriia bacterium]|nr:response regulator [Terriglobia bacterium]